MNNNDYDQDHDIDPEAPDDDGDCPHCAGTGEGQHDGQSCGACGGRGY